MDSKSLSHTKWKCQYHIVFIPKYRKKKLFGQLRLDVREILSTLCKYKGVEIIEGAVCTGLCTHMRKYSPKDKYFKFYGILKREESRKEESIILKRMNSSPTEKNL